MVTTVTTLTMTTMALTVLALTRQVGTGCSTDWLTIPCATNTNDPFAQNGTPVVCVDR